MSTLKHRRDTKCKCDSALRVTRGLVRLDSSDPALAVKLRALVCSHGHGPGAVDTIEWAADQVDQYGAGCILLQGLPRWLRV
jgi:hypothetical protein